MNETLAKILKFLSRSAGFFLINLAVILILFAFFINSSINNIDVLKTDLQSTIQEQNLDQSNILDKTEINEYCKNNPQDENCMSLNELNQNQEFEELFTVIKVAKNYIFFSVFSSLVLFLFGFMIVYFGTLNLLNTIYKVSVHLTINNFLAALYFNFIPKLINLSINNSKVQEITKDIPQEFIEKTTNIILNWIKTPVFVTVKLTIILGIIFLIISIILYFVKKKALKDKNKAK